MKVQTTRESLPNGGHVIIIGGGPAGAACALRLHHLAQAWGRNTRITVIEGKQFLGAHHYNQCVGVLSPPLPSLLEERLQLPFPYHLSRGEITGYMLHTMDEEVLLDGDTHPSIALRRVQFDAYMLDAVRARGITVLPARASELEIHPDKVTVYTENDSLTGDVIVGAFGLDEGAAALFARQTKYRPPQALSSIVTKYHPGKDAVAAFGSCIHTFLPPHPRIEFGAVTPKGNHLTINIAGKVVDIPTIQDFLAKPDVRAVLPNLAEAGVDDDTEPHDHELRFFKGRFPCSLAKQYYGDRYVMVGDAAGLVRAFKGKGVTSAVLTGIRAAETILKVGIDAAAFDTDYREANQDIIGDLPYGRGMRRATMLLARRGLLDPVVRAAAADSTLQKALFDAVSAHAPYRTVLAQTLHPRVMMSILRQIRLSDVRQVLGTRDVRS